MGYVLGVGFNNQQAHSDVDQFDFCRFLKMLFADNFIHAVVLADSSVDAHLPERSRKRVKLCAMPGSSSWKHPLSPTASWWSQGHGFVLNNEALLAQAVPCQGHRSSAIRIGVELGVPHCTVTVTRTPDETIDLCRKDQKRTGERREPCLLKNHYNKASVQVCIQHLLQRVSQRVSGVKVV